MDVVEELKKIKKKEQELYKFILQQFLDLEEFKKHNFEKALIDAFMKLDENLK